MNFRFIVLLSVLAAWTFATSCSREDTHSKEQSIRTAVDFFVLENERDLSAIESSVQERGNKESELQVVQSLHEIFDIPTGNLDDLQSAITDFEKTFGKSYSEEHADELIRAMRSLKNQERSDLYVQLNRQFLNRYVLSIAKRNVGASDFSFDGFESVKLSSNIQTAKPGQDIAVVLNNLDKNTSGSFSKISVKQDGQTIQTKVTQVEKMAIVNFTPSGNGKLQIAFTSSVRVGDLAIAKQMALDLN